MPTTFENPPLIEVIAEVRWGLVMPTPPTGVPQITITTPGSSVIPTGEEFFTRFATTVAPEGFGLAERLIPVGFPALPLQPVFRYRKLTQDSGAVLYQLGKNVFSANVLPPYKSWSEFEPVIRTGIRALLSSRQSEEPVSAMLLRYVNAFAGELRQNKSVKAFLDDVLGIRVTLPDPVQQIVAPGSDVKLNLQLQIPVRGGYELSMQVGEGLVNGQLQIMQDIVMSVTGNTPPTEQAIMGKLNDLHSLIHDMFVGMTQPLHNVMKPRAS
jgi:uncharacterized protein (TIGR04255 family)